MKIEALEQRMNVKNRAVHDSIVENLNHELQQKSSYAAAMGGARTKENV